MPFPRLAGVTSPRQRWFEPGRAGENAMVAGLGVPVPLTLGFGRGRLGQSRQTGNEIHRRMAAPIEHHLGRSIPVRCLQGVNHLARGAQ